MSSTRGGVARTASGAEELAGHWGDCRVNGRTGATPVCLGCEEGSCCDMGARFPALVWGVFRFSNKRIIPLGGVFFRVRFLCPTSLSGVQN